MTVATARMRAIGIDTVMPITDVRAVAVVQDPAIEFVGRYIDSLTLDEVATIHAVKLGILPITYADEFDPAPRIAKLRALGCPTGVTCLLDIESVKLTPDQTITQANTWAFAFKAAGFDPGVYVGAGAGLTQAQWTGLIVDRYVRSCSLVPEPFEGFCGVQLYPPNQSLRVPSDLVVDWLVACLDYKGRGLSLWTR